MNLKIKYLRYMFARQYPYYDIESMFEHFTSLLMYENSVVIPTSLRWMNISKIYETYYRR